MSYKIVRMYRDANKKSRVVRGMSGLTLEEAKEHCKKPSTHGVGWFDGFQEEKPKRHRR